MSVPIWCHVGAKVVCIREVERIPNALAGRVSLPVKGAVYTVRAARFGKYDNEPAVLLVEIENDRARVEDDNLGVAWNGEPCFGIRLFRPVVERKSDNEIEATIYHLRGLKVTGSVRSKERA